LAALARIILFLEMLKISKSKINKNKNELKKCIYPKKRTNVCEQNAKNLLVYSNSNAPCTTIKGSVETCIQQTNVKNLL